MSFSPGASPRSASHSASTGWTIANAIIGIVVVLYWGMVSASSAFDLPITQFFNALRGGPLGTLADAVYWALQPPRAVALVIVLMAVLYVLRASVALSLTFGLTVAATWLPIVGLKELFQRPRPDRALLKYPVETLPADWGFPSGHTAFVTAVAMALVALAVASASSSGRKKLLWARGLAAAAIVLSVVCVLVEGVHYPSDAVASVVWSSSVTPAVWLGFNALLMRRGAVSLDSAQHSAGQEK